MLLRNKFFSIIAIAFSFLATVAYAGGASQNNTLEESKKEDGKIDVQKVSEAFGHLIGKNLDSLGFEFNMEQVIKGMEDSVAGKSSPMNETECVQAISLVQEESFQKMAAGNLKEADTFMINNARNAGVVELEKHKLQYKVETQGDGIVVEEHFSPMIRYTGKFLDGKVFGSSQEDELISLDETIQGFSQGIVGMKEGEKRTIYIHPDLGYGTSGYLPPNSTLVFDIEVIKANATPEQEDSITSIPDEGTREIALPEGAKQEALR
ncbi:MAG: FKBP-type peptidyl-prolyl cis-trans isomerase [Simkaniaceae bacterium]|jgi:peptidylprolyl isomerase|nr:MAG: FKBP-type peptidyl-prolyl cis-trans isomerase [Simkaniaceae bacterium]